MSTLSPQNPSFDPCQIQISDYSDLLLTCMGRRLPSCQLGAARPSRAEMEPNLNPLKVFGEEVAHLLK